MSSTALHRDVMRRVFVRCEDMLPGLTCSASFAGTRTSVVHEAAAHAIDAHDYANNRRLREHIAGLITPAPDAEGSLEGGWTVDGATSDGELTERARPKG